MPRKREHMIASGAVGVLAGAAFPVQSSGASPWELLGGLAGGLVGGVAPDVLEPATTPNHRAFFHSGGFAALVSRYDWKGLVGGLEVRVVAAGVALQDPLLTEDERRRWEAERTWTLFARAFVIALLAGYGLHLLMDAGTRRRLPLL